MIEDERSTLCSVCTTPMPLWSEPDTFLRLPSKSYDFFAEWMPLIAGIFSEDRLVGCSYVGLLSPVPLSALRSSNSAISSSLLDVGVS